MQNKTIAFERWLISNYPEREDNPDYECSVCEGDGFIDKDYAEGEDVEYCISCFGTGSSMYDEYEKQYETDQERLRKF